MKAPLTQANITGTLGTILLAVIAWSINDKNKNLENNTKAIVELSQAVTLNTRSSVVLVDAVDGLESRVRALELKFTNTP
jgi:hypothetical protein